MNIKKRNVLLILLLVISLVIIGQTKIVWSEPNNEVGGNKTEIDALNQKIAEKRAKIKELEKNIQDYKKKIKQKRLDAVSLSNQLSILDNHLAQIELDIESTQTKLESLNLEIKSLNLSIEDKKQAIVKQQKLLAELIRILNYEKNKNYLEIFSSYKSFSDFYNRLQYIKKIETDLGQSAKSIRLNKEELEKKQEIAQQQKINYEKLKEELKNKQQDLKEQADYKQRLLAQTQSSELAYKTLLNNLKKQYQQTEAEINSIEQEVRRKLESENKLQQLENSNGSLVLSWPTQSRYITAYFHDINYPYRHIAEHSGIDIRAAQGTPVKAAASGYIARARYCSTASCFAYVMIVHADGISTLYGHLNKIIVKNDQFVARGDVIGYSGAKPGTIGAGPFTTGPHLHFEVRKNGIPVNPLNYLIKDW